MSEIFDSENIKAPTLEIKIGEYGDVVFNNHSFSNETLNENFTVGIGFLDDNCSAGPLQMPAPSGEINDVTGNSTELGDMLLHLCPLCTGLFITEEDLKLHVCQVATNTDVNTFKELNIGNMQLTEDHITFYDSVMENVDTNLFEAFDVETLIKLNDPQNWDPPLCDSPKQKHRQATTNIKRKNTKEKTKNTVKTIRNLKKLQGKTVNSNIETKMGQTIKEATEIVVNDKNNKSNIVCKICKNKFTKQSSLIIHMRRHNGEKKYECDYCKKKFVRLYDLDRHMGTHIGGKKFSCHCDICRKPFISKAGMLEHKRILHVGYTPQICESCGMKFEDKSRLDNHQSTHANETFILEILAPIETNFILLYDDLT